MLIGGDFKTTQAVKRISILQESARRVNEARTSAFFIGKKDPFIEVVGGGRNL